MGRRVHTQRCQRVLQAPEVAVNDEQVGGHPFLPTMRGGQRKHVTRDTVGDGAGWRDVLVHVVDMHLHAPGSLFVHRDAYGDGPRHVSERRAPGDKGGARSRALCGGQRGPSGVRPERAQARRTGDGVEGCAPAWCRSRAHSPASRPTRFPTRSHSRRERCAAPRPPAQGWALAPTHAPSTLGWRPVVVSFRNAGAAPILKQTKFKVDGSERFASVVTFLRKQLGFGEQDELVRAGGTRGRWRAAHRRRGGASFCTATAPLPHRQRRLWPTSRGHSMWTERSSFTTAQRRHGDEGAACCHRSPCPPWPARSSIARVAPG